MFKNEQEQFAYIGETYPEILDARIDDNHWDLNCTICGVVRGFQVTNRQLAGRTTEYGAFRQDYAAPNTYTFRCPVCHGYKQWIVYELQVKNSADKWIWRRYRVTSVPSEGLEDIAELPSEPASLRVAYKQAVRAMDANAHIAAAAMFRRALQIITRRLLGANPGNLANELNEVVGKSYNGVTITQNFATNGYVLKEAGNQGAHPDADPDLLDFTSDDASDMQQIFMELVAELFIIPTAARKARDEFLARRKIDETKALPAKPADAKKP